MKKKSKTKKTSLEKTKSIVKKSKSRTIVPLSDRVLVKEISGELKTASGIILPESSQDESGMKEAEVIAVGEGRIENGKKIPVNLKKGDIILFQWGEKVEIDGMQYYIVTENQVVAKIS